MRLGTGIRALAVVLAGLVCATLGGLALAGDARAESLSPTEKLARLVVRPAGSMAGYSREKFPH